MGWGATKGGTIKGLLNSTSGAAVPQSTIFLQHLLVIKLQVLMGIDQLSWAKNKEDEVSTAICSVLPPPKSMEFGRALSSLPLNLGSSNCSVGTIHSGTEKLGPLCTSILALQLTSSVQAWSDLSLSLPSSLITVSSCVAHRHLLPPAGKGWSACWGRGWRRKPRC